MTLVDGRASRIIIKPTNIFEAKRGTDLGHISDAHGRHTNRVGVATVAGVIGDQNGPVLVPSGPSCSSFSTVVGTDLGHISYAHGCHTNRVGVATVAGVIGDQKRNV